jgi:aminopeptidase
MTHQLAKQLATILTDYCSPVKPGEYITIVANPTTSEPLITALMEAVLRRGARPNLQTPLLSPDYSDYFELYTRLGSDDVLATTDPTMMSWVEASHAVFFVKAPLNTKALSTTPPERISTYRKGNQPFSERYLKRYDAGELRWTVVGWPTASQAQAAEMSLRDYARFVAGACGLDQPDPVAYWQGMRDMQERMVAWLADKQHAVVKGPGIDMTFNFQGRPWVSCHGAQNFPDGEIFTSPVEDSVNGFVEFNYPCIYQGNEVEGVRLVFKDGRCVEATATKGEEFLVKTLDTDPGARVLGEYAIGTNMGVQQMTRSILFDEKIGGSIHMALGRSYEESKGVNESAIHWDMIHSMQDGGTITVDGTPFYESGKFLV